jgi:flagellar hook-associated protein 3 FlgL
MSISTKLFATQMLDQFKTIEDRLQGLQTQVATGSRIPKSSAQPIDAVALSARNELDTRLSQYQKNLSKVNDRLGLADTTLETAINGAIRAKELFVASNTDTVSQSERLAARQEILGIRETLLGLANATDSAGDSLFGGFSTEADPFREQIDGTVLYRGDGGEHTLGVSERVKLPTSLNGGRVFMQIGAGDERKSAFDVLNGLSNALLTSTDFVQKHQVGVAEGLDFKVNASREPQTWSFTLEGPNGPENISATVNSDSMTPLVDAINSSTTGLAATVSDTGVISLSGLGSTELIKISNVAIEGYSLAEAKPSQYIEVYDKGTTTISVKISDETQGLSLQSANIEDLVTQLAISRTTAGARMKNAESQEAVLTSRSLAVKTEIGKLRDADIEALITELQTLLVTRDAARQTYMKVNTQSLFDFLR